MGYKWNNEQLKVAVETSTSYRQVLGKLGLSQAGGNYDHIPKKVKELDFSTKHFTGMLWSKGKIIGPVYPITSYLIETNSKKINSSDLRQRLIKEGLKLHKCEICSNTEWNGQQIPLELDHINGNRFDNKLTNLRIICPNCHAQTSTYRGKNKKKK